MNKTTIEFMRKAESFYKIEFMRTVESFYNNAIENKNPTKENIYKSLCLFRACAVRIIDEYISTQKYCRHFQRRLTKCSNAKTADVTLINPYKEKLFKLKQIIIEYGSIILVLLDDWQEQGATYEELYTLCNLNSSLWINKSTIADRCISFSDAIFVYNIDYKEKGDWIEDTPNAPLTICIKEFMLYTMLNTEIGKAAADKALNEVFPEIMDNMIYRCEDSDGNVFFVNNDGEIIDN